MTENEAIKRHIDECKHRIENIRTFMGNNKDANVETCTENIRIFETAIQALEEVQQYRATGTVEGYKRAIAVSKENYYLYAEYKAKLKEYEAIGTVEECQSAVEKQRAKTLTFYGDSEDGKLLCPACEEDLWEIKECGFSNCPYCGQKLNWG